MKYSFLLVPIFSLGLIIEQGGSDTLSSPMLSCLAAQPAHDVALLAAIQAGKVDEVRNLIAAGANVNSVDNDGWPLLFASIPCKTEILELLIKSGANVNASADDTSVLSRACFQLYDPKAIELLIKSGADVNFQSSSGGTALMSAVESGKLDFVKLLVKAGADINAKNKKGNGVFQVCRNSEIREFLIKSGAKISAADIQSVALANGLNGLKSLQSTGADVNNKDANGCTALILLVKNGWNSNATVKGIDALIQAGADVNAKDNSGKTALEYAIDKSQDKKIKALCKSQAMVSQALDYATAKGNKKAESIIRAISVSN